MTDLAERQCAARKVDYPFSAGHINVKILFGLMQAQPYEVGMARAMQMCGLELEGRHHRGVDDAWNIALLLSSLILKRDTELL